MSDEEMPRPAADPGVHVIDVAQVPLEELRRHAPRRALWLFLWLKLLRPLVVASLWLLALRYAWARLVGAPEELPVWQQGFLYSAIVAILVLMMVLVRLRQREVEQERASFFATSTLEEISTAANVSAEDLEQWQQAQRLVVHHDADGGVASAEGAQVPGRPRERRQRDA